MQSVFRQESGTKQFFPFSIAYLDSSQASQVLADERIMAVIQFGSTTQVNAGDPRQLTVALPELGKGNTAEVWYSHSPLQTYFTDNSIHCIRNSEVLFGHLLVNESDYPDLDAATYAAYRQLFTLLHEQEYPYLLRVWNYFPNINWKDQGLERYQVFCQGRHRALTEEWGDFEAMLPAACAIGTQAVGLLIYFLAAKQPGIQIENPRQVSAFHYPPQYGPKSPSFSRSVLKTWGANRSHLYISGTASIVGHATQHGQDLPAQLHETLENLTVLLDNTNRYLLSPIRLALLKVYVRPGWPVDRLRDLIIQRFNPTLTILFLQADICRSDLLIEIEGLGISA